MDTKRCRWALALAVLTGCEAEIWEAAPSPSSSASAIVGALAPDAPRRAPVREGGALVRAANEDALYLAHEDLDAVQRIPLPLTDGTEAVEIPMPGPPASVLDLHDRVLVTVRTDPGLLLMMQPDEEEGLVEVARTELPGDAWGLAVTPDETTALVTSAWTHRVSAVDIASAKKLWSVDVAREPRGVVVRPDGKSAYVTHLTRAWLTRIDDIDGDATATDVEFGAAPIRTLPHRMERASLGYAAVLSPDGDRLFVPRRALTAFGKEAWNGQPTVDVMLLDGENHLAQRPKKVLNMWTGDFQRSFFGVGFILPKDMSTTGPGPIQSDPPFVQPRAVVYRQRTHTLLVASEGTNQLAELDALAVDPSIKALYRYRACGAPTGIALSEDESTAHVFCRSTHQVIAIPLLGYGTAESTRDKVTVTIAQDPLSAEAAAGRQLFFDAADEVMSDGFACAGCHPEGRDDGHVWHHEDHDYGYLHAYEFEGSFDVGPQRGAPRQTPMLAGRVNAHGPYGWKGESESLRLRVVLGFAIHRWLGGGAGGAEGIDRSHKLVAFLREGLRPPARRARPLTDDEARGKVVFESPNTGCVDCHRPSTEFTDRRQRSLGQRTYNKKRFVPWGDSTQFKTPSLRYVGGTAPYYHDGSSPTLEHLIQTNGRRMGHTAQLTDDDKKALVAYLRTL